jgi:ribonuclease P protein component
MGIARRITLWSNKEVGGLLKKSCRLYISPEFDVKVAPTRDAIGKILIIVSSRIGAAPARNKFKRRVKALFYQEKLYQKGYHWVIFAKKPGLKLGFQALKSIILSLVPSLPKCS